MSGLNFFPLQIHIFQIEQSSSNLFRNDGHLLQFLKCQMQAEGYTAVSQNADLELPAVVVENSLVCFEVCTPQSVLNSTQRATTLAIFTSCGRIGRSPLCYLFRMYQNVIEQALF